MTRLQQILAAILAGQIVLAVILFWPRGTAESGGALLPGFDPATVVAVTIEDNDRNLLEVARRDGGWVLARSGDYPANGETVETLLGKIAAIDTNRLATRTSDSHDRLQIADDNFVARVRLHFDDDSTRTLFLGSSPNPRSTHVRLAGESETFVTGELSRTDVQTTAASWIDTAYISLPQEQVTALTLENDQGTFTLERAGDEEWNMPDLAEDEPFDQTTLNTMLSRLAAMRLTEPLGTEELPAYGTAEPQATLTVTAEDEDGNTQTYTLRVGAFDADDNLYTVKWSGSEYYVTVSSFNADTFVNATRDDFIAEPEPAGEGDGASQGG